MYQLLDLSWPRGECPPELGIPVNLEHYDNEVNNIYLNWEANMSAKKRFFSTIVHHPSRIYSLHST
jgi:hypothetical protein